MSRTYFERPSRFALACFLCIIAGLAIGQQPYLLKNINTTTRSGDPRYLSSMGNHLYFRAVDTLGYELWKTDGTTAGTAMVSDIWPQTESGNPRLLTEVNGVLFFFAESANEGRELWRSDGTSAGTALVKDIFPGPDGCNPLSTYSAGSELLFVADDGVHGAELWRSDGTASGTWMVVDGKAGTTGSRPSHFFEFNGLVYFRIFSDLWTYDPGTGTAQLEYTMPSNAGYPVPLIEYNGDFYFFSEEGIQLYKIAGGSGAIEMVFDFPFFARDEEGIQHPVVYNGHLYFAAFEAASFTDTELFRTDGTSNGTVMVKDIYPGPIGAGISAMTVANGLIYFTAGEPTHGLELWQSDGTETGTQLVADLNPGALSGVGNELVWEGSKLIFAGDNGVNGIELMAYDPVIGQIEMLKEIHPEDGSSEPGNFIFHNNELFFTAFSLHHGLELWKTDGTATGTQLVKDINTYTNSSMPIQTFALNSRAVFRADDGLHGAELWSTDGTTAGTQMVKDIRPGFHSSLGYAGFIGDKNRVFFPADDGVHGQELWVSDGTAAGTYMVADLWPGAETSIPIQLTYSLGKVFFFARDSVHGYELWVSDGTSAGTQMLTNAGSPWGDPATYRTLRVSNGVYFTHYHPTQGNGIWFTDGTVSGTRFVSTANAPYGNIPVASFQQGVEFQGQLIFNWVSSGYGDELWVSDGTAQGTRMVRDIYTGSSGATPRSFRYLDGYAYFVAQRYNSGYELFRTDGTAAGTRMVKDIGPGQVSGLNYAFNSGAELMVSNGLLWFSGNDNFHGHEPWISDGTEAGTQLITNLNPGPSNPEHFTVMGTQVYFVAKGPDGEDKIYISDGTSGGTYIVGDPHPGGQSHVSDLIGWNQQLFFQGMIANNDYELWTLSTAVGRDSETPALPELYTFPNPTLHRLSWHWESDYHGPFQMEIWSLNGMLLHRSHGQKNSSRHSTTVDVSRFPPGSYTLRIIAGQQQLARKFVVAR